MAIHPKIPGIHHICLRCLDLSITKNFYQTILGLPLALDRPDLMIFQAGTVFIAFRKTNLKQESEAKFNPLGIGMDHVALACETEEELNRFAKGLAEAAIENTGVKFDDVLQKNYVAFKDPDRIQWEFYMVK
jgi:catechol 2,3-dioxygenase-like lactoylglutathione lyase family enzyme